MVKITYDLDNVKDAEMVENYYWLKYQFKCIEFDILGDAKIYEYLTLYFWEKHWKEEYKTEEEIRDILLTFYNEKDLFRVADILNDIFCPKSDSHCYVVWLSILCCYGTKHFLSLYKYILIKNFGNK